MIRAAVLQSVRCASKPMARIPTRTSRAIAPCLSAGSSRSPLASKYHGVRCYSAPAGLSKQEVEGRIMDLLKNFDKVRVHGAGEIDGTNLKTR